MSVTVRPLAAGYTLLHCKGVVTVDDFVEANTIVYSELDPEISRYQIVDTTEAKEIQLPAGAIERLARQDIAAAQSLEGVAIAVVAPRDLDFGLSRMWQALVDTPGVSSAVFRDFPSAEDWILSLRRKRALSSPEADETDPSSEPGETQRASLGRKPKRRA